MTETLPKTPLDFGVGGHAPEKFAVDNGARGKLPVTPDEWSPKPLASSCGFGRNVWASPKTYTLSG